jgi:glycerol-3-phosphate dehydrogenase (NAD(P)+)
VVEAINDRGANPAYLPGVELPGGVRATARLAEALEQTEAAIVAVPSEYCREIYRAAGAAAPPGALLVSATKGLETDTLRRMTEVAADEAPGRPLAVLSGPSFALEVARGLPTAVVVASGDHSVAERVQRALATSAFRVYSSEDVTGVELAGAVKNVIAIAAGIVDGLGYGHNTVAALVTRGLAEISRLAVALGGRPDTLAGLAGLGDLVLTCTGALSRNRTLGLRLGRGASLQQAAEGIHPEGVRTALAACALAERHAIEMPIALQMKAVLHAGKAPRQALEELMLRSLKRE